MTRTLSFIIFITIFIVLISALNFYFIKKHRNIIDWKSLPGIIWKLLLVTLFVTPFATVFFSQNEIPFWAAITGFTGYSWIAFLFLFLFIHGTVDIILLIAEKIGFKPPEHIPRYIFFITVAVNVIILMAGFHEAGDIHVDRMAIETEKLQNRDSLSIVQISDVHFSPLISVKMARQIKKIIDEEKPDIVVSTGDLLDRGIRQSENIAVIMNSIKAPLGKFAVTGNHEFYSDLQYSLDFTSACGFTMIRNNVVTIDNYINLAGVDDKTAKQFGLEPDKSEIDLLTGLKNGLYTILLKHQPRINKESIAGFDLQLSGHTHGGQIFPFTLFVKIVFPYICGSYRLDRNTQLYVNRGTGTWGPPIRFLAPPEITVITLKKKKIIKK